MKRLLRFSIVSVVAAVITALLSSVAEAAPAASVVRTEQAAAQQSTCGYLCGRLLLPSGVDRNTAPKKVQLRLYRVTSNFEPAIAEREFEGTWLDCGMPFEFGYDPRLIDPNSYYALSATVLIPQSTAIFGAVDPNPRVITQGNPTTNITIQLTIITPVDQAAP